MILWTKKNNITDHGLDEIIENRRELYVITIHQNQSILWIDFMKHGVS